MQQTPWRAVPGAVATALMAGIAGLWVFWSLGELFYEGWGTRLPGPLLYLIPGALSLGLCLAALRWPLFGGIALIVVGAWFAINWLGSSLRAGIAVWDFLVRFFLSGLVPVLGLAFIYDHRFQRKRLEQGWQPSPIWWRRNIRYLVVAIPAVIMVIGFPIYWLPILLTRVDDGDRGARLVEGAEVTLVWAPQGPGWNWRQDFGGFPSWESLALYGVDPAGLSRKRELDGPRATGLDMHTTGLCRHLSADGLTLETEPQDIWRFPTAHEFVTSLMLHGENAGCVLHPEFPTKQFTRSQCDSRPDKETPLWAPDLEPIYLWVADSAR